MRAANPGPAFELEMARPKPQESIGDTGTPLEFSPPVQGGISESCNGFASDESTKKDKFEQELEKLVFGDGAGFRAGLSAHQPDLFSQHSGDERAEDYDLNAVSGAEHGLEGVDDANVHSVILLLQARHLLTWIAILP